MKLCANLLNWIFQKMGQERHFNFDNFESANTSLRVPFDEKTWFNKLNQLPNSTLTLSDYYLKLLNNNKDSFVFNIARKIFQNPSFWLATSGDKIPVYTPNLEEAAKQLKSSASVSFCYNNASEKNSNSKQSSFGDLNDFFVLIEDFPYEINVQMEHFAQIPVRPGGWFTQGFFVSEYKNQLAVIDENGSVSPSEKIPTTIFTSVVLASNIEVTLELKGDYSEEIESFFDILKEEITSQPFSLNEVVKGENSFSFKIASEPSDFMVLGLVFTAIDTLIS